MALKTPPIVRQRVGPIWGMGCDNFRSITGICSGIPKELLKNHTTLSLILHECRRNFPWKQYNHLFVVDMVDFDMGKLGREALANRIVRYYIQERAVLPNKRWTAFYYSSSVLGEGSYKSSDQLVFVCQDLTDATMIKMQLPSTDDIAYNLVD